MESSHPSPVDSVHPPPTMTEQIRPSKRLKSSEAMNPGGHGSTPSSPPTMEPSQPSLIDSLHPTPQMYAIESIREKFNNINPVEDIDSFICLVESHLQKMNTLSEAVSSSSEATDTISTETDELSHSEVRDVLLNILVKAKNVKEGKEQIPDKIEKLSNAVGLIAEGVVKGKLSRFWSDRTAAAQLEKTNQQPSDVRDSLHLDRLHQHWDKDVFLSHRGSQKNFVRQLRLDLTREQVSCFFDEDRNGLPLGERFPNLIFKAAEECKIAVLVLSEEFLCSKWPMLELSAFIRAKKSGKNPNLKLLPIFFMITTTKLSHFTKDSPEWQKLDVSNATRVEWQQALKEVRSINGLRFREDGNEVDLREEAVKEICCHLKGISPPQLLEFKPVGIGEQVREVKSMLEMESSESALAVIICGFGGMGKSTLASSVVESLWSSTDFRFCRVAIDNKTSDKTSHIKDLQKIILSYLGGVNGDLRDTLDGRFKIKKALENKCSLLFIDNVVDKLDIRELLPLDLSYSESGQITKLRIIITSRENDLKAQVYIKWKEYQVKGLSCATSKRFLSETIKQCQEKENIGLDNEERLINEVAEACKGVPLLLSIFGRYLRDERDNDNYQKVLSVLREGNLDSYRDEDLGKRIMHVYNNIKDVDVREGFLDICAYFHGWEWNLVADIVDIYVLKELHRKVLVSKGGSGEVIVHDILLLIGLKEAENTRFSNWKRLSDALKDDPYDLKNVKGISLVRDNHLIPFPSKILEAMHHCLRVLMLGDWVTVEGPVCQKAFPNLRYLRVGDITVFPFKDPFKLDKLRVFLNRSIPGMNLSRLPTSLIRIRHEVPRVEGHEFQKLPFENLKSLKSFNVKTRESWKSCKSWKSVKLPNALHFPASLVDLHLRSCKNLPKYIGHLTALESLILNRSDLKDLPQGLCELKALKHLSLEYCSELEFLPDELGMLSSLERLSIKECPNLQLLPKSFGELRISSLKLHSLVSLKELPNGFGNMPFLKDLGLKSCDSLMSLPDSFVQLKMLETLEILYCKKLSILPKDFGQLRCSKYMSVVGCDLLKFNCQFNSRWCYNFGDFSIDFVEFPREFEAFPVLQILNFQEEEMEMEMEKKDQLEMEMEKKDQLEMESISQFIKYIMDVGGTVAGQSKTREFIEVLKGNGIDHLLVKGQKVMVDVLYGKTICFCICNLISLEWIKYLQLYRDLQQNSNFIAILIPSDYCPSLGHGSCSRLSQCMPLATVSCPELFTAFEHAVSNAFFVLDKGGQISNKEASRFLLGWGLNFYPFTQDSIRESFCSMESESFLEILLHGMNIVGRKPTKRKMTFLYAASPRECHKMKCELEKLTQIHGGFEILYVGDLHYNVFFLPSDIDMEEVKQEYEDATQKMSWSSLSISDWIMFCFRCSYFYRSSKSYGELNRMRAVRGLASKLYGSDHSFVLVDNDGVVTWHAEDVVEMICELTELTESRGECGEECRRECNLFPFVKTWFGDEIDKHPLHPQHRLSRKSLWVDYRCNVCLCNKLFDIDSCEERRSYVCRKCVWYVCGTCWMAYAKLSGICGGAVGWHMPNSRLNS